MGKIMIVIEMTGIQIIEILVPIEIMHRAIEMMRDFLLIIETVTSDKIREIIRIQDSRIDTTSIKILEIIKIGTIIDIPMDSNKIE